MPRKNDYLEGKYMEQDKKEALEPIYAEAQRMFEYTITEISDEYAIFTLDEFNCMQLVMLYKHWDYLTGWLKQDYPILWDAWKKGMSEIIEHGIERGYYE